MLSHTIVLLAFVATVNSFCDHGTYFNPATEDLISTAESSWSYDGANGPTNWFSCCRQDYRACSTGSTQSPVNFAGSATRNGSGYVMSIPTTALQVKHMDHTVEVFAEGHVPFGTLMFEGEIYDLLQFHFHTPSEHRIRSEYSPVEVHFVHQFRGASMLSIHSDLSNHSFVLRSPYVVNPTLTLLGLVIQKLTVVAILFEVRGETIPLRLPWESLLAFSNLNEKIPHVGDVTTTPVLNFSSVIEHVANNKVYR
jgi:hypothetical protein